MVKIFNIVPPQIPKTQIGKFKIYEDDGDSVMGSILPNVFIKKITLEETNSGTGFSIDREPHISNGISQQLVNQLALSVSDQSVKPMTVTLDLIVKEKIEPDDVGLFSIQKIVNSMKIAVYLSLNEQATGNIISIDKDGLNDPYINKNIYIPQDVGGYLAGDPNQLSSALKAYIDKFETIQRNEVSFKEIADFNNISTSIFNASNVQQYLEGLDYEILSDGTIVYQIPFSTTFTIPSTLGGVNISHLTAFAVSYISYDSLFGNSSPDSFFDNQTDQLQALGYNETQVNSGQALTDFTEFIDEFGHGTATMNEIIVNGKVNNKNTKFVFRGTEEEFASKVDKIYHGPVHYHGQNNPAPDGYIGFMGGTSAHMNKQEFPNMPTPKLKEVASDAPGEILDYRLKPLIEQLFYNYSDSGIDLNFKKLTENKQSKSNDWLKGKEESVFSEPFFSVNEEGDGMFFFTIDIEKAILYNTAFPEFLNLIKQNSIGDYNDIISNAKISKLSISRIEASRQKNADGRNFINEKNNTPIFLVSSSDGADGKLKKEANLNDKGVFQANGIGQGDKVAQIAEPSVSFSQAGKRNFTVRDSTIRQEKDENKVFQYIVDFEIKDPLLDLVKSKLTIVKSLRSELEGYLALTLEKPEYVNSYSNIFTAAFIKRFKQKNSEVYVPAEGNPIEGLDPSLPIVEFYQQSQLAIKIYLFLYEVLFKLQSFSQNQKESVDGFMLSLVAPYLGSSSGVSAVLNFVLNVERKIEDLIDLVASTKSKKSILAADGSEPFGKVSSASNEAKNLIRIERKLDGVFDTNFDGNKGYQYLFRKPVGTPSGQSVNTIYPKSDGPNISGCLNEISLAHFDKVIQKNTNLYSIPTSFDTIGAGPSGGGKVLHLGPQKIKTHKGSTTLFLSDIQENMLNVLIDVLETNAENLSSHFVSGETPSTVFPINKEYTALSGVKYNTYKTEIPNMANLISSKGVSFEPFKKASGKLGNEFNFDSSIDTGNPQEISDNYIDMLRTVFGPDSKFNSETASDTSFLMIYLLLSSFSNYLPEFKLENYISLMVESVDSDGGIEYKSNLKDLPDQLLSVFRQIAIQGLANLGNNQPGDPAYESYKAEFETFLNTAKLALTLNTLVRVEYFDGYESGKIKQPKFKQLKNYEDVVNFAGVSQGNVILMRLVPHNISGFDIPENLKMPILDQYFFLGA